MRTHRGPLCVTCNRYYVGEAGRICGFCAHGSSYGAKERAVFEFLAAADWRMSNFVRDQALLCGSKRRPDGWVALHALAGTTMLVLEVDEGQHRYYNISCELKRLEEIHERHGGPLFVLRYNPDQPDGLTESKLRELADRCVDVLEGDHQRAAEAFGGIHVEFWGYTTERVLTVDRAWYESQTL